MILAKAKPKDEREGDQEVTLFVYKDTNDMWDLRVKNQDVTKDKDYSIKDEEIPRSANEL